MDEFEDENQPGERGLHRGPDHRGRTHEGERAHWGTRPQVHPRRAEKRAEHRSRREKRCEQTTRRAAAQRE